MPLAHNQDRGNIRYSIYILPTLKITTSTKISNLTGFILQQLMIPVISFLEAILTIYSALLFSRADGPWPIVHLTHINTVSFFQGLVQAEITNWVLPFHHTYKSRIRRLETRSIRALSKLLSLCKGTQSSTGSSSISSIRQPSFMHHIQTGACYHNIF